MFGHNYTCPTQRLARQFLTHGVELREGDLEWLAWAMLGRAHRPSRQTMGGILYFYDQCRFLNRRPHLKPFDMLAILVY